MRARSGESLYRHIRRAIESGELKPGQVLASTRALKEEFQVSFHGVLTALSRLEREGWVSRRRGSGTYVRDVNLAGGPRVASRQLTLLSSAHLTAPGVLFLSPAVKAALEEIGNRKACVDHQRFTVFADALRNLRDEGVVIGFSQDMPEPLMLSGRPPVVLVSSSREGVCQGTTGYDLITADSRQGAALAGRYLREMGCRRIVYVGASEDGADEWDILSRLRLEGLQAGWGSRLTEADLVRAPSHQMVSGLKVAEAVLRKAEPPFGIFATSDDLAMGICHGATVHGIRLGDAIRLVGFDGQPPRYSGDPRLTTVAVPLEEMGRLAVRLALERMEQPDLPMRRISVGCSLRKGDTA